MISDVTSAPVNLFKTTQKIDSAEAHAKRTQGNGVESQQETSDKVTLGAGQGESVTYSKPLDAGQQITIKFQMLQQIVATISLDQGVAGSIGAGSESINDQMARVFEKLGLPTSIDIGDGKTADLKSMTANDAQALIADNGYWGVEQTSSRIVDFAVGQFGNDPSKMEQIKESIMKGFNMAKEAFGGQLPDISQKTFDAVMGKLDKQVESVNAAAVS